MSFLSPLRYVGIVLVAVLGASASAAPADPLPLDPQLRFGKLDNGLSYYIRQNARPAQRVELRLVVNAGSILEDEDQLGAAHFVEHLGFNGSRHFKKQELVSYLQSIGIRSGADLNAFTSFDSTIYVLPVPTDKPGNLEQGFRVLEDWAHGMTLSDQAIEDERGIILEEKRLRSGYGRRMQEATLPKLANGSRYKDRLPIGTEASIAGNRPDALRRFYRDWYRPDLMAVIVVGDIDPEEAQRLVRRHFGHIAMPAAPRPRPQYPLPALGDPDVLVYADPEAPGSTLRLTWSSYQRAPAATVADFRTVLQRRLFSELMRMRLARLPVLGGFVGESASPFGTNQHTYTATAGIGPAGVHKAIDALVGENQRVRQFGFSAAELEAARRSVMASYEHAYKARDSRSSAALLGAYVRHFLAGEPALDIEQEVAYARSAIPAITEEEMHAYARTVIPGDGPKLLVYTTSPNGAQPVPTGTELLERVDSALKTPVSRHKEKELPAQLMAQQPAPGSIVEQREDKLLGVTRLLLSNGVKVVLKPTPFSRDSVQMAALRPGGQMLFADADKDALRFGGVLHRAMGAGPYSVLDLSRILAGKNLTLTAGMGPYTDHLNGSSNSGDLETLLQLNYLAMTSPRRDKAVFRSFVNSNATLAQTQAAVPEGRFADARELAVYGGHPRTQLRPRPEDYRKLDLDRSLELFRSRMLNAKGMSFYFVGDFEVEAIKPLLAAYVATLPVSELALSYRDPGIRQVPGVVRREVRAGVEQKSMVTYDFGGEMDYSRSEATAFTAMVDVLNLRIRDALRDRHQLIYTGGASGRYGRIPRPLYSIAIQLPTAPQHVEKIETVLWEEIAALQDKGPTPEELNKVRQGMLQVYRKSLKENGYWLVRLQNADLEGDDPGDILTVAERIEAVSAEGVRAAAQRFLTRERHVEMVLRPEA
ncbi:pitrilysin family protein [Massilia sp. MS-15]|uniref:M16 family metallopeptidase n=1 Tax=Massilia sp. MS-15 TaxID=2878200 RepID=UPI001CD61E20|nr:insulinase family protein [Massilia sp. MS-15]MCA1247747.1 insulinase family protein [Massilia sp. MS-15]